MSALAYLHRRAARAVLKPEERASIDTSVSALTTRLRVYLGYRTTHLMVFGSYRRGTLLPRCDDPYSDVDYMIAFADGGLKPQSYLDRLRRFVDARYPRSAIFQSSPTIVLDLNHIRFELVPAVALNQHTFLIPNGPDDWQATHPHVFAREVEVRNRQERNFLKPAIRLLKVWNAANGYPFESFALEQGAVRQQYYNCRSVRDYLWCMIHGLPGSDVQWKADRVKRAKGLAQVVRDYEHYHYDVTALQELKKLIPE